MPTSSDTTITMISGALPEPTIQSTFTSFKFSTANSVIRIVSTTAPPMRATSRVPRRDSGLRPPDVGGVLSCSLDMIEKIVLPAVARATALQARVLPAAARGTVNTIGAMRALLPRACAAALCALALTLSACGGSSTKTVTAASAPQTPSAPSTQTSSAPAKTATTTAQPSTTGSSATHTASEPAFAEEQHSAQPEDAAAAAALVRAHGYTADDTAEYHSDQTLRVLAATRTGSSDGYAQQAFFFLDGQYLGTDTKEPSAQLKVISQSDTEVAIAYSLYRPGEPLSSPGGGTRVVHFVLNDGKLTALDPIPPASSTSGLSRN